MEHGGRKDAGFGSLGMRVLSASVFGIGIALYAPHVFDASDRPGADVLIVGGLLSMLAAMAIDPAVLACETRRPQRSAGTWVVPWMEAREHRVGVRLGLVL